MTLFRKLFCAFLFLLVFTLFLENIQGLPKQRSSLRSRSQKKIHRKPILASVGATCKLKCPNRNRSNVQWYMNGKLLTEEASKFSFKRRHRKEILEISMVMKKDGGTYSCVVNGITRSWRIIVKKDKKGKCRRKRETRDYTGCSKAPKKGLHFAYCETRLDFSKCTSFAGDPLNIKVYQYIGEKLTPSIQVTWEEPRTGNYDLWGYYVTLIGLKGALGVQQCAQINSKKLTYWTFIGNKHIKYGATYRIKLQSLPSIKIQTREIQIKAKCQFEEFRNQSAICCFITNLNGTLDADEGNISLSWKVQCPENTPSLKRFRIGVTNLQLENQCFDVITTKDQDPTDGNFNYTIRIGEKCRRYNYSIMMFGLDSNNKRTKTPVRIKVAFPEKKHIVPSDYSSKPGIDEEDVKIIVAVCGVFFGIAIVAVFFMYKIFFSKVIVKFPPCTPTEGEDDEPLGYPKRVFLMHARCCEKCDWVIHCLGDLLNSTNAIEASVDLWHQQTIALDRMRWYGMEVGNADCVVVLASNKMKRLYQSNISDNTNDLLPIQAQLSFVAGEMLQKQPGSAKFISAYFTHNGQQVDVLPFLNSRLPHKLPKDLDRFIFHLLNIEAIQPYRTQPIAILGGTPAFDSKKDDLLRAVSEAKEYHMVGDSNNLSLNII